MDEQKNVVFGLLVRNREILIVKRTKQEIGNDGAVLVWGFPGGKVNIGESIESAAVREVYEETGFKTSIEKIIADRIHPNFPVRAFYFSCQLISDSPDVVIDAGTQEIRWVPLSDLESYFSSDLDPRVQEFLSLKNAEA